MGQRAADRRLRRLPSFAVGRKRSAGIAIGIAAPRSGQPAHQAAVLLRRQRLRELQVAGGRRAQHVLQPLQQRVPVHELADDQPRRPVARLACGSTGRSLWVQLSARCVSFHFRASRACRRARGDSFLSSHAEEVQLVVLHERMPHQHPQ